MPRRELFLESCEDRVLCSAVAPVEAPKPQNDPVLATSTHAHEAGEKRAATTAAMRLKCKRIAQSCAIGGHELAGVTRDAVDTTRHEIVFVDTSTQNYQQLVADISSQSEPGTQREVVLLDPGRDGIAQISQSLAGRSNIDAIHIISHGDAGEIKMGNVWLTQDQLAKSGSELESWRGALAPGADLLIYGCDVAGSASGKQLLTGLSQLTGADVNASTDNTGSALFGGNWKLEYATGSIETKIAVSSAAQQSYVNLLNVAVDSASSGSTNGQISLTVSHTTAGTNRLMLVSIATDPKGESVSTVTYNGVNLFLVGFLESKSNAESRVEIWALLAPDLGTHDVVVTMSNTKYSGLVAGVMTFTGVNQTTPLANFVGNSGNSTTASATVGSKTDDLVFAAVHSRNGITAVAGSGQTEYWDLTTGATNSSGTTAAGATSVTNTWAVNNDNWTAAAISVLAASNPPPAFNQSPGLWFSSNGNATSGTLSWNDSTVVQLGDPNLAFEPGVTRGTFSTLFDIDTFAADGTAQLTGLYAVRSNVTLGSGANSQTLRPGDVLFTISGNETFGGVAGSGKDVWLFRPLSPGDYSTGSFSILLSSPTGGDLHDISLVESAITVGGVALNPGDVLLTEGNGSHAREVSRFAPTSVGNGTTAGTLTVLLNGQNVGFTQDITAMDFINETFTLGGKTFQAGQFVMSLGKNTTVGDNNLAVTQFDLFTLDVTRAGAITAGTAALLVQGSDLGFSSGGEEYDALAFFLPVSTATITNPTVTEGSDPFAVFTISLSGPSTTATTFSLTTNNGTATGGGTDFGPALEVSTDGGTTWTASTTATIAAGATSVLVRTAINNDTLDENVESFTLTATRTAGTTTNTTVTGTATINDNDPPPAIAINDVTVDEGAGTATFTVSLNTASGLPVSVNYSMANGTAGAADFTAGSGTLNFAAGVTTQTIVVPILEDTLDELNETFTVNLASPTNATIADSQGIGTILDNDAPPSLTINDVTVNENAGTATFTVTLSAVSSLPVSVAFSTSNGTATSGADYTAATGTLNFAAGVTTQTITVPILEDTLNEVNETFNVSLANPTNATIARGSGLGTIIDNDAQPTMSINDVTRNEAAGSITFTVSLSAPSGQAVSVGYAATSGTATSGVDFTAGTNPLSGTLNFAAGVTSQTITLGITNDTIFENSESFNVTLSNPTNATIAKATGIGTILDDGGGSGGTDNDTPTVTITNPTVTEADECLCGLHPRPEQSLHDASQLQSCAGGRHGARRRRRLRTRPGSIDRWRQDLDPGDDRDHCGRPHERARADSVLYGYAERGGGDVQADGHADSGHDHQREHRRHGDDQRQRRAAVAGDQRRDGQRRRRDRDFHRDAQRGQRAADQRRLRDEQRDGARGQRLHERERDAEFRGGRDQPDDHRGDPQRRGLRE